MPTSVLHGIIQSGSGRGAYFTRLDWVVEQCRRKLGYEPFPGTLNVRVIEDDLPHVDAFVQQADAELVPDDPGFCSARIKTVTLNGVSAAVVLPSEDVRIHEKRVMEILAPCNLKGSLGLNDGDLVTIAAT